MNPTKIEIFFSRLFATVILKNKIVATIFLVLSKELKVFKRRMDVTINNDI